MDGRGFDDLVRRLATGRSRRSVLRGMIGGGAALVAARAGTTLADLPAIVDVCQLIPAPAPMRAGRSTSTRRPPSWTKTDSSAPIAAPTQTARPHTVATLASARLAAARPETAAAGREADRIRGGVATNDPMSPRR
jgi:hypothetical protein